MIDITMQVMYNTTMNKFLQTKEQIYCLGYLWADGWIEKGNNRIGISCIKSDLDEIKHLFESLGKCKFSDRNRKNRKPALQIRITNKELAKFLRSIHFENKSEFSASTLLELIPEELIPYFFRGYWDGDGCFYISKNKDTKQATLAGSYFQDLDFFIKLLIKLNIKFNYFKTIKINKSSNNQNSFSTIRFCGYENIKKFGDYIYNENINIGLKRKYDKYMKIIEDLPKMQLFSYNNITEPISYWLKKIDITRSSYRDRLKSGWSIEDALTIPKGNKRILN